MIKWAIAGGMILWFGLFCIGLALGEGGLAAPSPFSVHRSGGNCVYVLGNDIEVVPVGPEGC